MSPESHQLLLECERTKPFLVCGGQMGIVILEVGHHENCINAHNLAQEIQMGDSVGVLVKAI